MIDNINDVGNLTDVHVNNNRQTMYVHIQWKKKKQIQQ